MKNQFLDYVSTFISLDENEAKALAEYNPVRTFKKGKVLLREGEIADKCWFILKGCVRQYQLIDGVEKTTFFYTEKQTIAPDAEYKQPVPADFYLACVEETTLTVSDLEKIPEMFEKFPKLQFLTLLFMEQEYGTTKNEFTGFKTSSPEERYLSLLENRPDLIQRAPQHQLASYLGVTPESLSRIRKRLSKKSTD